MDPIIFSVTIIGQDRRNWNFSVHPKTYCCTSTSNHKSHSPYLLFSKSYLFIPFACDFCVVTRVLWLQFFVYLSTFYSIHFCGILTCPLLHHRCSMDNGDDVSSTSTNDNRTSSNEQSVDVSFGHTTNDGHFQKIFWTSTVWEFFNKKRVGANVRYRCNVPMCKHSFSTRSSATTVRGHLKNHDYFANDNQTFLTTTCFLTDERMKPKEERQTKFFSAQCPYIADAGLAFSTADNGYIKKMIECAIRIFLYHHYKAWQQKWTNCTTCMRS